MQADENNKQTFYSPEFLDVLKAANIKQTKEPKNTKKRMNMSWNYFILLRMYVLKLAVSPLTDAHGQHLSSSMQGLQGHVT